MSSHKEWVVVAKESDLQENARLVVTVNELSVLLLRRAGRVFAIENRCPHLGCKMARGKIEGFIITCPCHDWTFDIRSGEFTEAPEIKMLTFPMQVRNDHIYIEVEHTGG
ncbi:MAG: Rieske (2Fe-2S) protein [Anaerolineae bacterium]